LATQLKYLGISSPLYKFLEASKYFLFLAHVSKGSFSYPGFIIYIISSLNAFYEADYLSYATNPPAAAAAYTASAVVLHSAAATKSNLALEHPFVWN